MKIKKIKEPKQDIKSELPGYPLYPDNEDIYNRGRKEPFIDPENLKEIKKRPEDPGKRNVKDFKEDLSGSDLDIPGSELDDGAEEIGSEDEENNYYSLGGDNHLDLEENKGD